jgi:hypothetical protein
MRLKKYNEFESLNESFQKSDEYYNFIRENSLDNIFFLDNLAFVEDIDNAKVNLYKYLCDKYGNFLTMYDDDVDHYNYRSEKSVNMLMENLSTLYTSLEMQHIAPLPRSL